MKLHKRAPMQTPCICPNHIQMHEVKCEEDLPPNEKNMSFFEKLSKKRSFCLLMSSVMHICHLVNDLHLAKHDILLHVIHKTVVICQCIEFSSGVIRLFDKDKMLFYGFHITKYIKSILYKLQYDMPLYLQLGGKHSLYQS